MPIPIEARSPNWLPLPGGVVAPVADVPVVDEDDAFPRGRVERFYPRQGTGTVVSDRDETIPFSLSAVELVGPKGHARYLAVGGRVGFDVSWTSHGLHISRMKVY